MKKLIIFSIMAMIVYSVAAIFAHDRENIEEIEN